MHILRVFYIQHVTYNTVFPVFNINKINFLFPPLLCKCTHIYTHGHNSPCLIKVLCVCVCLYISSLLLSNRPKHCKQNCKADTTPYLPTWLCYVPPHPPTPQSNVCPPDTSTPTASSPPCFNICRADGRNMVLRSCFVLHVHDYWARLILTTQMASCTINIYERVHLSPTGL